MANCWADGLQTLETKTLLLPDACVRRPHAFALLMYQCCLLAGPERGGQQQRGAAAGVQITEAA